MSTVFQRDLSLTPEASQARKFKGIQESLEKPPFRPWAKNFIGVETGLSATRTQVNGIGEITIPETGLYFLSYSMDTGSTSATFIETFISVNGGNVTQAVGGTAVGRNPHVGVWSGALPVGTLVAPVGLSTTAGAGVIYFTSFNVMRIA